MLAPAETRIVEVGWPVPDRPRGLPRDHGYALFGALCRAGLIFHAEPEVQVAPLDGDRLIVRAPVDRALRLATAGLERLMVAGQPIRLGESTIHPLRPAARLASPLVTVKGKTCDQSLRAAVAAQLGLLGVAATIRVGARSGLRIAGVTIVGYAVRLDGLSPAASVRVQAHGLGGRNRMGCGVFRSCP